MTGDLQRDGWEIDDAEELHRKHPDKFFIPSVEERKNLHIDDRIQMQFLLLQQGERSPEGHPVVQVERMWVTVIQKSDGRYIGRLESLPVTSNALKPGDMIDFGPEHVSSLLVRKDEPRTVLHAAVVSGNKKTVAARLKDGADVNARDANGMTPLHYAGTHQLVEIAALLIDAGAEIDPQDNWGNTPLSNAVFSSRRKGDLIRLLRAKGADPFLKNGSGVSPISLARTIANYDVAQYFSDIPVTSNSDDVCGGEPKLSSEGKQNGQPPVMQSIPKKWWQFWK